MKKHFTYRSLTAIFLVGLILQVVVLQELHHLLEHHHASNLHCGSADTHLHGEEYAPVDCFICFFHFAPAKLEFSEFILIPPVHLLSHPPFFHQNPWSERVEWHFRLRGPPTFAC
ncbi:MAG: hypothetical protein H6577_01225 [Lewinellaceae bacterium]|nr:hypothetical protein [Saprospiraceae bacterium]MCB9336726.1 hypothetical protein [Lewinellaceae bacterium]